MLQPRTFYTINSKVPEGNILLSEEQFKDTVADRNVHSYPKTFCNQNKYAVITLQIYT